MNKFYETGVVYSWPHCQICLECAYGIPISVLLDNEKNNNLNGPLVMCSVNFRKNDGVNCRMFVEEREDLDLDTLDEPTEADNMIDLEDLSEGC